MAGKRTMTLNLSDAEMKAVEELARKKELSKTSILRQALRLYQLVETRLAQGEKIFFEDDKEKKSELMLL